MKLNIIYHYELIFQVKSILKKRMLIEYNYWYFIWISKITLIQLCSIRSNISELFSPEKHWLFSFTIYLRSDLFFSLYLLDIIVMSNHLNILYYTSMIERNSFMSLSMIVKWNLMKYFNCNVYDAPNRSNFNEHTNEII